jgi:hypothetical protein
MLTVLENKKGLFVEFEGKKVKVGGLLSTNMKLLLDKENGYEVVGVSIAPAKIAGYEVCPSASEGCRSACIYTSGRGRFNATQIARIKRKLLFFQNNKAFKLQLFKEIASFVKSCERKNVKPAIRLNVFSDIPYEIVYPELFTEFPEVKFYDYTKRIDRVKSKTLPKNYHLTYSRSENTTDLQVLDLLNMGVNVAIPFNCSKDKLPKTYLGMEVINGDKSDIRFLDKVGVIVGLSVKGDSKVKKSDNGCNGFIVNPNNKRFNLL